MGGGMATSAWRAGIPIIVWNRSQQCRVPGDGTERIAVGHH
jgi:3-hydroxyisobutyrate dehydrogenase-like beta-hydroxyacid dehydrogenase